MDIYRLSFAEPVQSVNIHLLAQQSSIGKYPFTGTTKLNLQISIYWFYKTQSANIHLLTLQNSICKYPFTSSAKLNLQPSNQQMMVTVPQIQCSCLLTTYL
jgi:hypothetical protein